MIKSRDIITKIVICYFRYGDYHEETMFLVNGVYRPEIDEQTFEDLVEWEISYTNGFNPDYGSGTYGFKEVSTCVYGS